MTAVSEEKVLAFLAVGSGWGEGWGSGSGEGEGSGSGWGEGSGSGWG